MVKKIFLHIGLHKTGSTSFQAYLRKRTDWLGRKHDVCVPNRFRNNSIAHHNLAWQITGLHRNRFDPAFGGWDELRDMLKDVEQSRVILTSEELDQCDEEARWKIREYLDGYDVTILLVIRNQIDLAYSFYSQIAKTKATVPLDRFLDVRLEDPRFHFHDFVQSWREVFGRRNVEVFLFEDIKSNVVPILMGSVCDCDPAEFEDEFARTRSNASPKDGQIQVMQAMFAAMQDQGIDRDVAAKVVAQVTENTGQLFFGELHAPKADLRLEAFLEHFARQNALVNDTICSLPDSYFQVSQDWMERFA